MIIQIEINDGDIWSLEQFLKTQRRVTTDPLTKAAIHEDIYPGGVSEVVQKHVAGLVAQVTSQWIPPRLRAIHEQKAALEKQIAEATAPKIVDTAEGRKL